MSSVNPVFLLPGALQHDAESIAKGFVASLTLGAGQFCTNPGLLFAPRSPDLDRFIATATAALSSCGAQTMLTSDIHGAYQDAVAWLADARGVDSRGLGGEPDGSNQARGALFVTDGSTFERDSRLAKEVFGPASLLVHVERPDDLLGLVDGLEGQLTATIHMRKRTRRSPRASFGRSSARSAASS